MNTVQRQLLATLGAYGVIYGAKEVRDGLTLKGIYERSGVPENINIEDDLIYLEDMGFVKSWDTSHYGYGDMYVEGHVVWRVTEKGLLYLWGALSA